MSPRTSITNISVEAFFDLVPNLPRLLHRARFLARLALPPTHSNFPHPSLLHAICACAGTWCSPAVYAKSSQAFEPGMGFRPDLDGKPEGGMTSFASRQIAFAKDCVQDGLDTGNRLFDVVRAMVGVKDGLELKLPDYSQSGIYRRHAHARVLDILRSCCEVDLASGSQRAKCRVCPKVGDAAASDRRLGEGGEEGRSVDGFLPRHGEYELYNIESRSLQVGSAASGWGTSISLDELVSAVLVA